ncbi:MAG: thiamine phosphate synthase [Daejeonella sp.]
MKKYISKFHYLTQDLPNRSHAEQTQLACKAGAKWVQYRCFSKKDDALVEEIHHIASICDDWGATLILTDHYHLLDQVDAQGVHIENIQADLGSIRAHISDEKTLGASANTLEDILRIYSSGVVDYIGCGPFNLTTTKVNDYPLLGIKGYEQLMIKMRKFFIDIPVLAVGGIGIGDVGGLLSTGIYGIAVSAGVNMAAHPAEALKDFYKKIY